jgi:hypothetical protein
MVVPIDRQNFQSIDKRRSEGLFNKFQSSFLCVLRLFAAISGSSLIFASLREIFRGFSLVRLSPPVRRLNTG